MPLELDFSKKVPHPIVHGSNVGQTWLSDLQIVHGSNVGQTWLSELHMLTQRFSFENLKCPKFWLLSDICFFTVILYI